MSVSDNQADLIDEPWQFYESLFGAAKRAGVVRPAAELADVLSMAASTADRFARPLQSDEAPSGTGARSDLHRLILTIKHLGLRYDLEGCQELVNSLQEMIDHEVDRRAALMTEGAQVLKERAMASTSGLLTAIGLDRPEDVRRQRAASDVSTKLYLSLQRHEAKVS